MKFSCQLRMESPRLIWIERQVRWTVLIGVQISTHQFEVFLPVWGVGGVVMGLIFGNFAVWTFTFGTFFGVIFIESCR